MTAVAPTTTLTVGSIRLSAVLTDSFVVSLAIQVVNVITGILLARVLGPTGRGELAAIILWPSLLAAIGALGLAEAAAYRAAITTGETGRLAGTLFILALIQSAVLISVGYPLMSAALNNFGDDVTMLGHLYLAFIPLNLLSLYAIGFLAGLQRFRLAQILRLVVVLLGASFIVALALADRLNVRAAVIAYLCANLVTAVVAVIAAKRAAHGGVTFNRTVARSLFGFGVRTQVGNTASLLSERLDQVLISIFLAPAQLGLYVVAVTLTSLSSLVGSAVSFVALPSVAAAPDDQAAARTVRYLGVVTVAGVTVVTVPVLLLTPDLLEFFFGASFEAATNVARVLLVAGAVLATNRVLAAILQGRGRPLTAAEGEFIGLIVTVVALAALLPLLGLMGAALASLLAYSAGAAWNVRRVAQSVPLREART